MFRTRSKDLAAACMSDEDDDTIKREAPHRLANSSFPEEREITVTSHLKNKQNLINKMDRYIYYLIFYNVYFIFYTLYFILYNYYFIQMR